MTSECAAPVEVPDTATTNERLPNLPLSPL